MSIPQSLINTDTLSALFKQNPVVISKAKDYLKIHNLFTFSLITRYEILRGLKAKQATKQIQSFDIFCENNIIIPITDKIIDKASDIYGELKRTGQIIGDADILIASTALILNIPVITNNENHFKRIPNLQIINWLKD
jgi:tRNA(fMet)-specific endonuclease VapC